jgi:hypothetical protein
MLALEIDLYDPTFLFQMKEGEARRMSLEHNIILALPDFSSTEIV